MEVHHHPNVEKKSFKEYFLEFLMIFLAVTLGFFAENIREYFSNNERVKQISQQMVEELKNDTANLNILIAYQTDLQKKADSVFNMLQEPIGKLGIKKLQHLINDCFQITTFTPSSGALNSVKNELNLKQFSSTHIGVYISDYEFYKNQTKSVEGTQTQQISQIVQKFMQEHFSADDLHALRIDHTDVSGKLRKISADDLEEFRARIVSIEDFNRLLKNCYKDCLEEAIEFINYVRKEYNIEDK